MLSHGAAFAGRPDLMPAITAGTACVILAALAAGARRASLRALLLVAVAAVPLAWHYAPTLLLFLPPAAINLALGVYFASTLAPGREPRIATYAHLERGEALPPDLTRHARRVTWIWSVFFFASAALGLVLAAAAPLEVWSAFSNVISYGLVALLFVGEYFWRKRAFPQYRHAPLLALFRIVAQDRRVKFR